jgi:putative FmdB family regulatory protein
MPIYEIICHECGKQGEVLVFAANEKLSCPHCGSGQTSKLMSAPSSLTGREAIGLPGPNDTGCCGSSPAHAGCAGPGSCCGKNS